ncbi:hypothetical protein [Paraburkholderia sp. 35.1]|uniref:hypothetical protein n=1 Tax=Paraburkholderia sp. 35.1 TaxID=2991058 RepID=UPI003D1FF416
MKNMSCIARSTRRVRGAASGNAPLTRHGADRRRSTDGRAALKMVGTGLVDPAGSMTMARAVARKRGFDRKNAEAARQFGRRTHDAEPLGVLLATANTGGALPE